MFNTKILIAVAMSFCGGLLVSAGAEDIVAFEAGLKTAARSKTMFAKAAKGNVLTYSATGELNITHSDGSIMLYFDIEKPVYSVTSVSVTMDAYDVDYTRSNEKDLVYFNDVYIGRLTGGNNIWNENSFTIPVSALKEKGQNVLRVDVDVDDGGWVTRIGWATLYVNGSEGGIELTTTTNLEDRVALSWTTPVKSKGFKVFKSYSEEGLFAEFPKGSWLDSKSYIDTSCEVGCKYYYFVQSSSGEKSEVRMGQIVRQDRPEISLFEMNPTGWFKGQNDYVAGDEVEFTVGFVKCGSNAKLKRIHIFQEGKDGSTPSFKGCREIGTIDCGDFTMSENCEKTVKVKLPVGSGGHGLFLFKIKADVIVDGSSDEIENKDELIIERPVYFDKDVGDDGEVANWFKYWAEDGACPQLKQRSPKVIYAGKFKNLEGVSVDASKRYPEIDFSGVIGLFDLNSSAVYLVKILDAFGRHMQEPLLPHYVRINGVRYDLNQSIRVDNTVDFIACTVAHETEHFKNYDKYVAEYKKAFGTKDKYTLDECKSLDSDYAVVVRDSWGKSAKILENIAGAKFAKLITQIMNSSSTYCDFLTDEAENNLNRRLNLDSQPLRFLNDNTDSFNLSSEVDSVYEKYGDNELLSRMAEHGVFGVKEKDWSSDGWLHEHSEVLDSSRKMMMLAAANGDEDQGVTNSYQHESCACESLISVMNEDNSIHVVVADIQFEFTGCGTCCVEGYLTDAYTNEYVAVSCETEFSDTNKSVRLFFEGIDISRAKLKGPLRLGAVLVSKINPYSRDGELVGVDVDFPNAVLNVSYADCESLPGYIVANSAVDISGVNEVAFTYEVEANIATNFVTTAKLYATNGLFVAQTSVTNSLEVGTNTICVAFDAGALYRAGIDGPYEVKTLQLWQGGELIDAVADVVTFTNDYKHVDFMPTNTYLFVDNASSHFVVPEIIGGKYGALKFVFDVTNKSDNTLAYKLSTTLFGRDSGLVASRNNQYIYLSNGVNRVEVVFPASIISSQGVDGPYWVNRVELEAVGEDGNDVTFVPDAVSGAYLASDFGASPVSFERKPWIDSLVDYDRISCCWEYELSRPCSVEVAATLVDKSGNYVARVAVTNTANEAGRSIATLNFLNGEFAGRNAGGPYTISCFMLTPLIEGEPAVYGSECDIDNIQWKSASLFVDVNANGGSATGHGWENAFKTIQQGVNAAGASDVVFVRGGTYGPFITTNKSVVIRSVDGAYATIIDGGGTNRCATLGSSVGDTNVVLQGFTLRNGNANGASAMRYYGGGVCYGTLVDCVVANNVARYGGGVYDASLFNCSIVGNRASFESYAGYGGGVYWGGAKFVAKSCYIADNVAYQGSGMYLPNSYGCVLSDSLVVQNTALVQGALYGNERYSLQALNCTIACNNCAPNYRPGTLYVSSVGSIIHGNYTRANGGGNPSNSSYGSLTNCCTTVEGSTCVGAGIVTEAPAFVESERRIYDLLAPSGENIVGAGKVVDTNGMYKVGLEIDGHGVVARPGAVVDPGDSLTFTAEETGRAFEGFFTNGVFATNLKTLVLENIRNDILVTARFAKRVVYVAANGNDSNDGLSAESPKRSIDAAFPIVENGESIEVGPGTYGAITLSGYSSKGKSVRVYSTHGAGFSTIDGGGVATCARLSDYNSGSTNIVLEGFTLINGYSADNGGGAQYGTLLDCMITDNFAERTGGGAYYSRLVNCVMRRNKAGICGGGMYNGDADHCTICANEARDYGGGTCYGTLNNSIVSKNLVDGTESNWYNDACNSCCTYPNRGTNPILGDPLLVDGWNGDARLRVGSPCIIDSEQVCGAYVGEPVEGISVSVGVQGAGSATNSATLVASGSDVTIEATETVRPFLYWDINGDRISSRVYAIENVTSDVRAIAVFGTRDWYVDAEYGDDSADGTDWSNAKQSIQAAVSAAVDDEIIYVEAGTYDPISTDNKRIRIEGVNGAEMTFIDGAGVNRCATLGSMEFHQDTVLVGFTLINGYAPLSGNYAFGGGAYSGTLENCIISNCIASGYYAYGGGAYGGCLNNCLVANNRAMSSSYRAFGGGTSGSVLYSCTVARNVASGSNAAYGGGTFGDSYSAYNTIIWDNRVEASVASNAYYPNSYYQYLYYCCTDASCAYRYTGTITYDPLFVDADAGDFHLRSGSPCLNAGYNSYVQGEVDLDWAERIQGGRVDMGCYEGAEHSTTPTEVTGVRAANGVIVWDAQPEADGYMIYRSTSRMASSARYIGMSDTNTYVDETAVEGTKYYYWVKAFNTLGMGPMGEASGMLWPEPLEIVTGELPEGVEGVPYEVQLEAAGGAGGYTWRVVPDSESGGELAAESMFALTGTARGWRADDNYWSYSLPFMFSFCGQQWGSVYVGSNGTLSFGSAQNSNGSSENYLANSRMIAGYWRDLRTDLTGGDIFVDEGDGCVTFRWAATHYSSGTPVNFSITLYEDGAVRLSYGSGNAEGAMIGYSAGDGVNYYISEFSQSGSMDGADDIWFFANLPPGLKLSEDGLLTGTCSLVWNDSVTISVEDALGEYAEMTYPIVIRENPNARPIINAVSPSSDSAVNVRIGGTQEFEVSAADPDGAVLHYTWVLDGVLQLVPWDSSSFAFSPTMADHGAHILKCIVSDGYWTNKVFATWQINACHDIYVDANVATSGNGRTWVTAMKSLRAACLYAVDGDRVYVADGVYEPIVTADKSIVISSVNGASSTVIDGGHTNRCAYLSTAYSGTNTVLEGFSLINGYQGGSFFVYGGGSWGGTLNRCVISNCHIVATTGNSGYDFAYGGGSYYGVLNNCLVVGNSASSPYTSQGGGTCYSKLVNCTVVGNETYGGTTAYGAGSGRGGGVYGGTAYNTIIADNNADSGTNAYSVAMYYCCAPGDSTRLYQGTIKVDPLFASAASRDFRLLPSSPCRGTGDRGCVVGNKDLAGMNRTHGATVNMGCYEEVAFTSVPSVVTGIIASEGVLAWDVQPEAEHYRIYRNTSDDFSTASPYRQTAATTIRDSEATETDAPYWYWIVAINPLGEGPVSSATRMVWPRPVVITTESLPGGVENEEYSVQLMAEDGTEPYTWQLMMRGYDFARPRNSFRNVGVAQGWRADDQSWEYELPFDFEFYGVRYKKVYVNSNGYLSCDIPFNSYSWSQDQFVNNRLICGCWRDLYTNQSADSDIFVLRESDAVTFRWSAYSGGAMYNFSIALYSDGRIRLSYGSGNDFGGCVGVSAGDGVNYKFLNWTSSALNQISDVGFTPGALVPANDGMLPQGLTLSNSGILSGKPTEVFSNDLVVAVTDFNGGTTNRTFELVIAANSNLRPVVESVTPVEEFTYVSADEGGLFSVAASDPESASLIYEWYVDGELVEGEEGPSFLYKPSEFGYDYRELYDHTIECFVSDGFWYGEVVCSWIVRVTRTFYVDASASGERTGETPANAFNSIEEAMYEAQEGDVILVAPGVYEPFYFSGRSITVKAISGSADTIIDCYGGYGLNGPDYWRPFDEEYGYPIRQPVLEGFTIRNGSQAASGVKLVGCRIVDMAGMVADGCQLENCIVTQCESSYYAMIRVCKLTGCTIAGNSVSGYAVGEDSRVYNSIVYGNETPDGEAANYSQDWYYDWDGTNEIQVASVWLFNSCTSPLPDSDHGNIDVDPLLVDCRNGDVRLRLGSPCVDAGSAAYVNCACDIEGNDRISGVAPDMGAIEGNPVSGCVISTEVVGGGSVTPMTGIVDVGNDVDFVADDSARPFISFMTNGVWASGLTQFTWRNVLADGTLTVVFSNFTFYVDAANGDDANDGLSWATAKATLQEAIDEAIDGEEIFVAAGVYAPIYTDNKKIKIVGVEGAENTIIDGGCSERCATLSEDSGRVNATLVGFTLQNGWAYYGGGAYGGTLRNCIIKENEAVECGGGCAFSRVCDSQIIDNSVVVPDTVDQHGRYVYRPIYAQGGGAYGGELINCAILRNEVIGNPETEYVYGGGVSESTVIGCVVAENYAFGYGYETSGGGVGNSVAINCTIVKNCVENELTGTFGDDSLADGGGYGGQYYYYCCNSIVFGNVVNGESNDLSARFANNVSACVVGADPGFVDFESGDYALLQGSRCVDGGYTYVYDEWGMPEHDMRGNFRVQGASIDIGAFEVAQEYYIEQTTIDLGSARQDCVIRFRAASDWSVESSASWFAIDDKDGTGSSALQGVVLSVDENASGIERAADLTLHVGASTVIITVRQLAKVELPTATQRYYGLFVGLNEYTYASSLSGCVSDANNMLARCLSHGYWNAENVLALTNERATKDSVREQISQMARTAKAGDVVLFYQSSHGGNVTDPYGNMTDDVYLCEYDTPYYDYELAEDLSAFKAGVKVVILIDACHSGGLFKALNGADAPVRMPTGGFNIARRVQELMRKSSRVKSAAKSEMIDPSEIGWITACDSDQYSYDSPEGGVFTGELLYGWGSGEADEQPFGDGDGYMNFYELFKYAHEYATGYGDTEAQCFNVGALIRTIAGVSDDFDKPALPGISEALNATNVAWTTSFGTGWFSQSDVSHDCVSAAQSGAIGNAASSILTGTVSGSGTLSFWWKVSSEENKDYLRFALDGVGIYSVSGDQDWRQVTVVVDGEGEHLLTWTYSKGKSGVAGSDCGWVDEVAWLPDVAVEETEVSLAEALDTTSVAWGTNGDAAWRGVDNGVIDFARSGGIGDNEESILSATLVGPGELSFKWKTSCEEYDGLDLVVDGEIVRWASGETDWMTVALSLSEGSHQVQWVYWKDESDSEGDDCAYIDQVVWQSSAPITADPIPDIGDEPSPAQVQEALSGSEDVRLFENIVDGDNYNAYRAWADEVELAAGGKAGKQAVKDSPNAWLSFALDSATLIQTPPADGDVKVEKFEQTAMAGSFDFTVRVENIPVGDDAKPGNLAKVFGIEGGSTLTPQDMSSDKVDITFGTPENGKVKFTAGPKDKTQPTFFMKVKVK